MNLDKSLLYLFAEAVILALAVLLYWFYWRGSYKTRRCNIRIGDYSLIKKIGQGGMADIYLARYKEYKWYVVFKVLHEKCAADTDNVHRFLMEGKNLQTIKKKFPNSPVVQVYDYGRAYTMGRYIIIMEYLLGENLKDILTSKKFINFNLKLLIIKEVAKALQASHALKIFHRDVSPENIIINDNGKKVTLIDFGIAKELLSDNTTPTGVVLGKLNYISPEQFKGDKVTAKSDIYALGAVSFYLIEGKPLYNSRNPYELMNMHMNFPVPQITEVVPVDLKEFIYRMLGKDPAIRPYANEVVEKMRYFLNQVRGSGSRYESISG